MLVGANGYAYVKLFTDPNRAARILLCVYIGSSIIGAAAVGYGPYGNSGRVWGWVAMVYGVLMACLCLPLVRPRFARLANMLNALRRDEILHSHLPTHGGCKSVSQEPGVRLSLWKLYRQVAVGSMILPDEADYDVENNSGTSQRAR